MQKKNKKNFINWKSLRTKSVLAKLLEKHLCIILTWKSVSMNKVTWISIRLEKYYLGTNWINMKSIVLNFIDENLPEICSFEVQSTETAFLNGETKTKATTLTGRPGEPISNKCQAWKLVSLEENLWSLIWLTKKPWKLFSTIEKTDEPISSRVNPRNFFFND